MRIKISREKIQNLIGILSLSRETGQLSKTTDGMNQTTDTTCNRNQSNNTPLPLDHKTRQSDNSFYAIAQDFYTESAHR